MGFSEQVGSPSACSPVMSDICLLGVLKTNHLFSYWKEIAVLA